MNDPYAEFRDVSDIPPSMFGGTASPVDPTPQGDALRYAIRQYRAQPFTNATLPADDIDTRVRALEVRVNNLARVVRALATKENQ